MKTIYTLGPDGTSSVAAAEHYRRSGFGMQYGSIAMHETYSAAHESLLDSGDLASCLLVANAFPEINVYYMDQRMQVMDVFRHLTPRYGVASKSGDGSREELELVAHPATVPLVENLIPPGCQLAGMYFANSTAAAAKAVAEGKFNAAITTELAASNHGLKFIGPTLVFEMVWTVFGLKPITLEKKRSE